MSKGNEVRAVALGAPEPDPTRRGAERVRSVTSAFPLPHSATRAGDAQSPGDGFITRLVATFAIPSDLLHARPSSLADAHAGHQRAAGEWNAWLISVPRHAWGWLHLAVKAVTHAVDWLFGSPARFIVAALIVAAAWFWL